MKIIGSIYLLIAFLTFATTCNVSSMDEPPPEKKLTKKQRRTEWITIARECMFGIGAIQQLTHLRTIQPSHKPPSFTKLPDAIQQYIISLLPYRSADNLEATGLMINAFARVNKSLNQLINNAEFSLQLITSLSHRFNIDNETVCNALQTKEAKRLLTLQTRLKNLCDKHTNLKDFINVYKHEADLTFTYKDGMTLLLFCIRSHNVNILDFLLKRGAEPNISSEFEMIPLMQSLICKNDDAVALLLAAGANPDVMFLTSLGTITPLSMAIMNGNGPAVELLLAAGAHPEMALLTSEGTTTPLDIARSRRDDKITKLLEDHIKKNMKKKKKVKYPL